MEEIVKSLDKFTESMNLSTKVYELQTEVAALKYELFQLKGLLNAYITNDPSRPRNDRSPG